MGKLQNMCEIIPTRCNNCVYSSQCLYSTCFGWQSITTPRQGHEGLR